MILHPDISVLVPIVFCLSVQSWTLLSGGAAKASREGHTQHPQHPREGGAPTSQKESPERGGEGCKVGWVGALSPLMGAVGDGGTDGWEVLTLGSQVAGEHKEHGEQLEAQEPSHVHCSGGRAGPRLKGCRDFLSAAPNCVPPPHRQPLPGAVGAGWSRR